MPTVTEKQGINKKTIVLAVFGGLLLTASFPKVGWEWMAWFALVPLVVSCSRLSPGQGFRMGLAAGFAHALTLMYWLAYTMQHYGHLPFYISVPVLVLFCLYLALFPAAFSWLLVRFSKAPLACVATIPLFWVSTEFVRSFLFSGFPWELLGHSQYPNIGLIQISDIAGVYGISFLIALGNAAIFISFCLIGNTWQGRPVSKQTAAVSVLIFAVAFFAIWGYGKWRVGQVDAAIADAPAMNVTVVQGNIDQLIKWKQEFQTSTTEKYVTLSSQAQAAGSELVVWPETATPFYFGYDFRLTQIVQTGIMKIGTHFLFGSPSFEGESEPRDYYNSAYLIGPNGQKLGRYDKVHLVPFGEYVPLKEFLPFVGKIVEHVGDFKSGDAGRTLQMGDRKLGAQVCYEIIFPELCREMVKNGAVLLVNLTNDAWYGMTSAPYQHFSITIFRAVENKRSLVRSANTGISGFIDPAGRVIAQTAIFQDAVLSRAVPVMPESEMTVYTKYGDWFASVCVAASIVIIIIGNYRRKKTCHTN